MRNATLVIASVAAALGLAFVATPAQASATSPDVHVTGIARVCVNDWTVHHFRLENLGDQRRVVRGRVVRDNGFTETFERPLRSDRRVVQRVRLGADRRAVVRFRSQGRIIMRVALVGDCPTKGDVV